MFGTAFVPNCLNLGSRRFQDIKILWNTWRKGCERYQYPAQRFEMVLNKHLTPWLALKPLPTSRVNSYVLSFSLVLAISTKTNQCNCRPIQRCPNKISRAHDSHDVLSFCFWASPPRVTPEICWENGPSPPLHCVYHVYSARTCTIRTRNTTTAATCSPPNAGIAVQECGISKWVAFFIGKMRGKMMIVFSVFTCFYRFYLWTSIFLHWNPGFCL